MLGSPSEPLHSHAGICHSESSVAYTESLPVGECCQPNAAPCGHSDVYLVSQIIRKWCQPKCWVFIYFEIHEIVTVREIIDL